MLKASRHRDKHEEPTACRSGIVEHPCPTLVTIVSLPGGHRVNELNSPENATAWLVTHELAPEGTGLLAYCQLQLTDLRGHLREVPESHTKGVARRLPHPWRPSIAP
jgi:hypothetical protein